MTLDHRSSNTRLPEEEVTGATPLRSSSSSSSSELTDSLHVREWLKKHHSKEDALLEKFLLELRWGGKQQHQRETSTTTAALAMVGSARRDALELARRTLQVLQHMVGSTQWKSAAQLLWLLRGLGRELQSSVLLSGGYSSSSGSDDSSRRPRQRRRHCYREPVVGNLVRRVMAAVREEATREAMEDAQKENAAAPATNISSGNASRWSLQNMLWALPQHVRSPSGNFGRSRSLSSSGGAAGGAAGGGDHDRQESFQDVTAAAHHEFPVSYYQPRPNLKQAVMEAIQEIVTDLEDMHRNIHEQAVNHVHAGEVILTTCGAGRSKTIELFLKAAAMTLNKKQQQQNAPRTFQVLICQGSTAQHAKESRDMAESLQRQPGMHVSTVTDAALFAIMPRVSKVLLPAHAVLANGGLVTLCGCHGMALAAHYHSVPVLCVTGLLKLTPTFPQHPGSAAANESLNDFVSPTALMQQDPSLDRSDPLWQNVECMNPMMDYIPPEQISLYVTNVGNIKPSFIYRLLAESYHIDDWPSFTDF